jgi:type III secretory pathway component EscV
VSAVTVFGLAIEFLFTTQIIKAESGILGLTAAAIKRNPSSFIHYLSALNFIIFFLALLFEHIYIEELDTVAAIFSILLARKIFRLLRSFSSRAVKLESASNTEYLSTALQE